MPLSNSFNYSVTAADVVQDALENLNVLVAGESVDSADMTVALAVLNKLVKQWTSHASGFPGMRVWRRKTLYLFPQYRTSEYAMGPGASSPAKVTESYSQTTISAAEAAGQTVLSVTSSTGMTNGQVIGIELNDGTIQWTTISTTGAGTVTVNAALTAAAAAGNKVYWFTTDVGALYFPTRVVSAYLRDADDNTDREIALVRHVEDYEALPDKFVYSDFAALWYFPERTQGRFQFDVGAQDVDSVVRMVVEIHADDLDASTDDLAFPVEAYAALGWELALRLAPKYEKAWTQSHSQAYAMAVEPFRTLNPDGFRGGAMATENDGTDYL